MSNTPETSNRKRLRRLTDIERAQLFADFKALPRGVSVETLAERWEVSRATVYNVVASFSGDAAA